MTNSEDHLRYLENGLEILEDYLFSNEMFWTLGGSSSRSQSGLPTLSLGGLLLSRASLLALPLTESERLRFERQEQRLQQVRSRWQVAWSKKAAKSFSVRLRMWGEYINELRENPEEHVGRYAYEVRWRVMLQLLLPEASEIETAELDLLKTLDTALRQHLAGDKFIWEPEMARGFPADEFWFLYGHYMVKIH